MSLKEIRKDIDLVDSKILKLLNHRMELVLMANKFKTQIEDKEREKQLLGRIKKILAELIKAASKKTQVIISTQSPALVDSFEPENVIVVNREKGASTFKRLETEDLSEWLKEYSLGDLWRRNIVAGGPVHE